MLHLRATTGAYAVQATAVVLVALACACSRDDHHEQHPSAVTVATATEGARTASDDRVRPNEGTVADPSTLVLTHSWSGRTATVGRAWADMLGARFLRFADTPDASATAAGPTAEQIRPQLDLARVRRVYLGFPIWNREPAPPVWQLMSELDLSGKQVVLFFTYLHDVDESAVESLEQRLHTRGAELLPRIGMRVPESMSPAHLERRAEQALLARPDLWSSEPKPAANCSSESAPPGHTLCRVPAGSVWLGDDGSDESPPGATPPRRLAVAAFDIDRSEVTIGEYRQCVQAGQCAAIDQGEPCSQLIADGDDKPMPCVSLDAARAYCKWAGMRLPNEAEWTRASRADGATPYPWGFEPPGTGGVARGNFGEKRGAGMPGYSLMEPGRDWQPDGVARLATGCSYPAGNSPFGVCDLAGNIGEWVEPSSGGVVPVFKGGTWMDPEPWAFRIASRGSISLDAPVTSMGFCLTGLRCARSAPP